jgi:hypothetical protein
MTLKLVPSGNGREGEEQGADMHTKGQFWGRIPLSHSQQSLGDRDDVPSFVLNGTRPYIQVRDDAIAAPICTNGPSCPI